jgi:hypothetical protein
MCLDEATKVILGLIEILTAITPPASENTGKNTQKCIESGISSDIAAPILVQSANLDK